MTINIYKIKCTMLGFIFILSFRVLMYTPLESYFNINVVEALFILSLILFVVFYFTQLFMKGRLRLTSLEILILSMSIYFPLHSAVAAWRVFGQPLIYGLATQRVFFLLYSGLLIFYLLKIGYITIKMVEDTLVFLSWSSLIIYTLSNIFINPLNYIDSNFIGYNKLKGGYILRFNMFFVLFGLIYYSIRYFQTHKQRNIIFASFFFTYLFFIRQDRTIIIVAILTILFYAIKRLSAKSIIKYSMFALILICSVAIVMKLFFPETFDRKVTLFSHVFNTLKGEKTDEGQVTIRLAETAIAVKYILKNPMSGNGELSNRWQNGYERIFGFFYPSDIGMIGIVFIYGVLGTILLYVQFIFAYSHIKKVTLLNHDYFFSVCKFFLFAHFMDSLSAGHVVFYAANSIVFIAILYYFTCLETDEKRRIIPLHHSEVLCV